MILPDYKLREWAQNGGITPYADECINPASVDLRWSGRYRLAHPEGWSEIVSANTLRIERGDFLLLDTLEYITMPADCAGEIMLKSSLGRQGLEHLHAGFFDPSFTGSGTLEIENRAPWPLTITRGQRIIQIVLHLLSSIPDKTYQQTGRYNGQHEPEPAR
jgi:dCTP deaminase